MEPVRIPANKTGVLINASLQAMVLLLLQASLGGAFAVIAFALFVFCALIFVVSIPHWARTVITPALIADENGITDATGAVPGGLVYWQEIAAIETIESASETLLLLRLHDPQTYLARLPDTTRHLLTGGADAYGTPCVVAASDLGVSVGAAKQILEAARARFIQPVRTPIVMDARGATDDVATPPAAQTVPSAHWWTAVPPEERTAKPTQTLGRNTDR